MTSLLRYLRPILCLATLIATTACSNNAPLNNGVAQAYNSTGMFEVPTYTRSIFSTTNF